MPPVKKRLDRHSKALIAFTFLGLIAVWQTAKIAEDLALEELRLEGNYRLEIYARSVHTAIGRFRALPVVIASHPDVTAMLQGDSPLRLTQANQLLERISAQSGADTIFIVDHLGIVRASSNWRSPRSFVGQDTSNRRYLADAITGSPGGVFAIGDRDGAPSYYLSQPIRHEGRSLGVSVIKINLDLLEVDWTAHLESVLLVDHNEVVLLSSHPEWKHRAFRSLPLPMQQRIASDYNYAIGTIPVIERSVEKILGKGERIERLRTEVASWRNPSVPYLVQSREMPAYAWTLIYLSDLRQVQRQVNNAAFTTAAVSALLVVLGLFWRERHLKIHSQLQGQQALSTSEAEKRTIIDNTDAGLVTLDAQGCIVTLNPMAASMFGYTSDEVCGKPLDTLVEGLGAWPRKPAHHRAPLHPGQATGCHKAGNNFPIDVTICPVYINEQPSLLVTIHDISERAEAEQALREARDQLEERVLQRTEELQAANLRLKSEIEERVVAEQILKKTQNELVQAGKLAALGQLSAGIVHEINQPLTALRTYMATTQLLLRKGKMKDSRQHLEEMIHLIERMGIITSHLRIFARKSDGVSKPTDLIAVIKRASVLLTAKLRAEQVELALVPPAIPLWVLADEVRLEQVFVNLLNNSIDAVAGAPVRRIVVSGKREALNTVVRVEDTGSGIAQEDLAQLFDPFFTTKDVGKGLGLGLSISYGIVADLGGTIQAGNRPESGAVFVVTLPYHEALAVPVGGQA